MDMRTALVRALVAALSLAIVGGPFAAAGHSAPQGCSAVTRDGDWTSIAPPEFAEGGAGITAYAIHPVASTVIFATNGSVIMRSVDGGCSWEQVFGMDILPTLDKQISSATTTIKHLVIPPSLATSNQYVYATLEDTAGPARRIHFATSQDAGETWTVSEQGLPLVSGPARAIAAAPSNPRIVYLLLQESAVGSGDGLYASHNGGVTWEQRSASNDTLVTDLTVDPGDPAVLWLWGPSPGLFRSDDGGHSRSHMAFPAPPVPFGDVQPGRIMAYEGETQSFAITKDDGSTWTRIGGPRVFAHSITHTSDGTVVVSGHNGVYRFVEPDIWLPIAGDDRPDIYDLQANIVGDPLLFGLSVDNTLEVYDAIDEAPDVGPFSQFADEVIGGVTELNPKHKTVKIEPGEEKTVTYDLGLPPHPTPLDVFFLVDTSMSMEPSINGLRQGMQQIIRELEAARIDVHFGLGEYKDYPIPGYGDPDMGDFPYRLDRAIGPADADLADALEKLESSGGGRTDLPESQLTGLYQAATGAGDPGFVEPGQDAGFRPGSLKVIVHLTDAPFHTDSAHPSPPFDQVVQALKQKGILQIGLAVYGPHGPDGLPHLTDMALATDTQAPRSVDCDGDGTADVQPGDALACVVSTEQSEGVLSLAPAIIASLRAVTSEVPVQLSVDNAKVLGGIAPTGYPAYNVMDAGRLEFDITYSCPSYLAGQKETVRVAALVANRPVAHANATIVCRPIDVKDDRDEVLPVVLAPAVLPRFMVPAPPPPPPPITESAPGTQQMFQAQPAAAAQEQEEVQTALAWQASIEKELAEEYSFTSLRQERPGSPWPLYAAAGLMAAVYAAGMSLRTRLRPNHARNR